MNDSRPELTWGAILKWYLLVVCLCFVGTYFAYNGPLSSDAWRAWSGAGAWKRDVMRTIVSALLGLFLLWNFQGVSPLSASLRKRQRVLRLHRYERVVLLIVIALVFFFQFVLLPRSFVRGLEMRSAPFPHTFGQIWKPYIPYLLYTSGLWIGIVYPIFLMLLRSVPEDWKEWRDSSARLDHSSSVKPASSNHEMRDSFVGIFLAFQDYVVKLKSVAERYVPVLLVTSVILLYEQLTTSNLTVTPVAVESGKVALWLLLGPALIVCLIIVAIGYQKATYKAQAGFGLLIRTSTGASRETELLNHVLEARDGVLWDRTPGEFVLSVLKSATLSVPLLFAVTTYVLNTLGGPEGWVGIFVPRVVVNFFRTLYH